MLGFPSWVTVKIDFLIGLMDDRPSKSRGDVNLRFGKWIYAGLVLAALAPGVTQAKGSHSKVSVTQHVQAPVNFFEALVRGLAGRPAALDRRVRADAPAADMRVGRLAGELNGIVASAAARHGVPAALIHRIIHVESGGRCSAENGIASGVMQVRPATARGVGVYGNLHDCRTGVEAGVRYLRLALNKSGGNWAIAATLYNRGIGADPVRSQYARLVMQ